MPVKEAPCGCVRAGGGWNVAKCKYLQRLYQLGREGKLRPCTEADPHPGVP